MLVHLKKTENGEKVYFSCHLFLKKGQLQVFLLPSLSVTLYVT